MRQLVLGMIFLKKTSNFRECEENRESETEDLGLWAEFALQACTPLVDDNMSIIIHSHSQIYTNGDVVLYLCFVRFPLVGRRSRIFFEFGI